MLICMVLTFPMLIEDSAFKKVMRKIIIILENHGKVIKKDKDEKFYLENFHVEIAHRPLFVK
jgi:hypothetical protein